MHDGTIAYCSREDDAPPMFAACLARLAQRHQSAKILHMIGNDVADQRNQAVKQAEGDWIWFIDTDMLFAPSTLERLLAHHVDVVQVLCLMRHPPHDALVYTPGSPSRTPLHELRGRPGLVETDRVGAGGTLYRRHVFARVAEPWFEGIIGREDISLALKAHAAGMRLFVDLATPVRHLTPMCVFPAWDVETGWSIRYEAMNGASVTISQFVEA